MEDLSNFKRKFLKKPILICCCILILLSCRKKTPISKIDTWVDYRRAYSFLTTDQDSAFFYFNKVVTSSKDNQQVAMAFTYMSIIQSAAGDYFGCQESLFQSLKFQNRNDPKQLKAIAANYNELATASFNLKDYDRVIEFSNDALKLTQDSISTITILNNKAAAYREKKEYKKAIQIYHVVFKLSATQGSSYARILTNLANTKWLIDPRYPAATELLKALRIREREKDLWGLSSSYAHLTDFYESTRPDSARYFAGVMYRTAIEIGNPDEQLLALTKLIKLAPDSEVRNYSLRYQHLNDSLQISRNKAKNQFALIRYESEKRKADNLKLSKENSDKKYQLIQERFRFYGVLVVFLITAFLGFFWYKRRRRIAEQEKRDAIKESNQRASKKVHDTLANDLYRLMKTVQYKTTTEKEWLVDNLDNVYQRARDLSYSITDDIPDFDIKLSELIKSFASENIRVNILGNNAVLWQDVPPPVKIELRYIFQELMVNMQKHSGATDVVFRFERRGNHGIAVYHDNGIGIQKGIHFNNGLNSAENRMKAIGGKITFDTDPNKGLFINMSFSLI